MADEDAEQVNEANKRLFRIVFWVLFMLVWIWLSWMADDWSVGWKYRTPRV